MRKEYDFSKAKRAKDVPHLAKLQAEAKGKTRITIMLASVPASKIPKPHHPTRSSPSESAKAAAIHLPSACREKS